jgi:ABC-type branched-subunit amino acid transport system substrate-binding protein
VDKFNLRHLRAFLQVARCGSISGASERVFLSQPAITQALAPETAQGLISAAPYFMVVDNPANETFLEKYHDRRPGEYVDTFGEGMYSAVHLFAIGAERAGSLETEALLEGLRGASFDAPQGTVTIDPDTQHISTGFHIAEATGNQWDEFDIIVSQEGIEPAADCGAFE